ncbi:unnamed protein product [Kuraishia capsulata CBS 1993]|uniref:3'(2'),5'-bisphosphate nucleotidase n=1 Tax=Kuraishia capsulata CBS 1993 TaxID=1382522 RepID=W6MSU3_9ASCO|nr:uncharacterized protein KUCA_T00005421001 [Kuraishia capsulata CBS 1993]CDK29433.1 unnamed protein product [Kuraishia capsulata CBS 1993]
MKRFYRTMASFHKELLVAQLAVKRASILTKKISDEIAAKTTGGISKTDKSPVTIGDFAAQAIVINSILKNFPSDEVVGEEDSDLIRQTPGLGQNILEHIQNVQNEDKFSSDVLGELSSIDSVCSTIDKGDSKGGSSGRIWALDPIDGTKGFLRGDQFAVCLALIVDGEVQLGVIGCPNLLVDLSNPSGKRGGLFSAIRGRGSYYQNLFEEVKPLDDQRRIFLNNKVSFAEAKVCEGVEKGHSSHELQALIKEDLNIVSKSLNLDSQVKYCALARGDAEIYLRLPKDVNYQEKIWDHAAGNVLITEAEGVVSDIYGNSLDFGKGRTLQSQGIVASSKTLHADIIKTIKKIIGENGEELQKYC